MKRSLTLTITTSLTTTTTTTNTSTNTNLKIDKSQWFQAKRRENVSGKSGLGVPIMLNAPVSRTHASLQFNCPWGLNGPGGREKAKGRIYVYPVARI